MGQKASKLSKEDITRLKKETKFTTRELQQWFKGFQRDAPTGILTKDDFIKIHKQFYPFGDPTEYATYAFEAFDVQHHGFVAFPDFIVSLSIASRGTSTEKLKWGFRMYDRNGDGFISYDDLLRVVSAIYRMIGTQSVKFKDGEDRPVDRVNKIWTAFNKSLDNKEHELISQKEFSDNQWAPDVIKALSVYDDLI